MLPVNWEENQQRFILHQHEGMSETIWALQVLVPQQWVPEFAQCIGDALGRKGSKQGVGTVAGWSGR